MKRALLVGVVGYFLVCFFPGSVASAQPQVLRGSETFGSSIAAYGNTLVVGQPGGPQQLSGGAVLVFEREGGTWTLAQELNAEEGANESLFGNAVAIDCGRLIVSSSEKTYIYEKIVDRWVLESSFDQVGRVAIDVDGSRLAIADGIGVYLYKFRAGQWSEETTIPAPEDFHLASIFGSTLALDNETLLVGVYNYAAGPPPRFGGTGQSIVEAHVYKLKEDQWQKITSLLPGDGLDDQNRFFAGVSLSDGNAIIEDGSHKPGAFAKAGGDDWTPIAVPSDIAHHYRFTVLAGSQLFMMGVQAVQVTAGVAPAILSDERYTCRPIPDSDEFFRCQFSWLAQRSGSAWEFLEAFPEVDATHPEPDKRGVNPLRVVYSDGSAFIATPGAGTVHIHTLQAPSVTDNCSSERSDRGCAAGNGTGTTRSSALLTFVALLCAFVIRRPRKATGSA